MSDRPANRAVNAGGRRGGHSGDPDRSEGRGDGRLSTEALARLDRGVRDQLPSLPDLADHHAVRVWREAIHRAWGEGIVSGEADHVRGELGGVPVRLAGPADAPLTVVYAHGGGYVLGSAGVAAPITARLARAVRVVSVDYRLAPEHPYPVALDDLTAVYRTVARAADAPVALAGDSAGGALVVGVALRMIAGGGPRPGALVLFCPHLDHAEPRNPTDRDPAATGADPGALAAAYRRGTDPRDPLLSPCHADPALLAGLPPTLVQSGTADDLRHQAIRFVRRARSAGAPVELDLWEGLWHTWQYHRELPEADRAVAEATAFLLGRTAGPMAAQPSRPELPHTDPA